MSGQHERITASIRRSEREQRRQTKREEKAARRNAKAAQRTAAIQSKENPS